MGERGNYAPRRRNAAMILNKYRHHALNTVGRLTLLSVMKPMTSEQYRAVMMGVAKQLRFVD